MAVVLIFVLVSVVGHRPPIVTLSHPCDRDIPFLLNIKSLNNALFRLCLFYVINFLLVVLFLSWKTTGIAQVKQTTLKKSPLPVRRQ